MAYQMLATAVTLNDLEGQSSLTDVFQMQSVKYLCNILHDFN